MIYSMSITWAVNCYDSQNIIKTRFTKVINVQNWTINLLHDKKQKLGHIFNVELRESSKAFGNLRIQRQSNAA